MNFFDTSFKENMQLALNEEEYKGNEDRHYNEILSTTNNSIDVEDLFYKIEKDARRYKRFLGNDSRVVLI